MNTIRILRQQKGLTLKQLSAIVGISYSALSRYENGERQPDYAVLARIASALGATEDYLLTGQKSIRISDFEGMPPEQIAEFFASLPGFPKMATHPDYQNTPADLAEDEKQLLAYYKELNENGKRTLIDLAQSMATSGIYARTPSTSELGMKEVE